MSRTPKDEIELTRLELKILQLLEKTGEPVRIAYLADKMDKYSPQELKAATDRLVRKYEVFKTGDGRYQIATMFTNL